MIPLMETLIFIGYVALFTSGLGVAIKMVKSREKNDRTPNPWKLRLCYVLGLAIAVSTIAPIRNRFRSFGSYLAQEQEAFGIKQERARKQRRIESVRKSQELLTQAMKAIGAQNYETALRLANESIKVRGDIVLEEKSLQSSPQYDPGRAHAVAGQALYYLDRYDEALACLEKTVAAHPLEEMGIVNLAWFFATCPDERYRDAKRALKLMEREHNGGNYAWQGSVVRAAVLAELGRFREAKAWLNMESIHAWGGFEKPFVTEQLHCYWRDEPYRKRQNDRAFLIHTSNFPESSY